MHRLEIYKMFPEVELPRYATLEAACFDLRAHLSPGDVVAGYSQYSEQISQIPEYNRELTIYPGDRYMVPTGLKFLIPPGHSVRIHPRSGLSIKQGLILANCEAVIDADYNEQVFILIINVSQVPIRIYHGDRLAQAELIKDLRAELVEVDHLDRVSHSSRIGGFGSTGVGREDAIQKKEK